jgi:hypothetical protein
VLPSGSFLFLGWWLKAGLKNVLFTDKETSEIAVLFRSPITNANL